MADNKVNEAAWNLTRSISETNQAIADSAVAAQERNVRFTQSTFENGVELLKSHAEGTRSLMHELPETPQEQQGAFSTLVDGAFAAQQRNIRFALSTFENGIELLKSHAEGTRNLMQTVVEQSLQQQEIFRTLSRESMNAYVDFFRSPFSYYQQAFDAVKTATDQGMENVQKATENVQKATRQGLENMQNAGRQVQNASKRATE
jgi:hypothetical protein